VDARGDSFEEKKKKKCRIHQERRSKCGVILLVKRRRRHERGLPLGGCGWGGGSTDHDRCDRDRLSAKRLCLRQGFTHLKSVRLTARGGGILIGRRSLIKEDRALRPQLAARSKPRGRGSYSLRKGWTGVDDLRVSKRKG